MTEITAEELDKVLGKWAKKAMLFYGIFWVSFVLIVLALYWLVFIPGVH